MVDEIDYFVPSSHAIEIFWVKNFAIIPMVVVFHQH
jgi:hypothetical protein